MWIVLTKILKIFTVITDWRTIFRELTGQPVVDAVLVANLRDVLDRKIYFGDQLSTEYVEVVRNWLNNFVASRTIAINVTAEEMLTIDGHRKAKKYFVDAVKWAETKGAKAVLLAANTKRLFKNTEMAELRKKFPSLIFTIGDSGTAFLLKQETLRALKIVGLKPGHCRIAVLGPYGFLGEMMTQTLVNMGFDIIGVGPNANGLRQIAEKYNVATCKTFFEMKKVDAVVACTNSKDICLTADNIKLIRRRGKKLLVIDVAVPPNLVKEEYLKCCDVVIRDEAGNAYAHGLSYVLGVIAYRIFRHTRGRTFGCFAETMSMASALKRGEGEQIRSMDWFTVSNDNIALVERMFKYDGFRMSSPCCFGKPIISFNLDLDRIK